MYTLTYIHICRTVHHKMRGLFNEFLRLQQLSTQMREKEVAKAASEAEKAAAEALLAKKQLEKAAIDNIAAKAAADSLVAKAAADSIVAKRSFVWNGVAIFGALGLAGFVVFLVADHILHENETIILWNMKRVLRSPDRSTISKPILPVPGPKFEVNGSIPTMLIAPTGAGKSTLMQRYLHECAEASRPARLIHFRTSNADRGKTGESEKLPEAKNESEAVTRLNNIARDIFVQVGYRNRRSYFFLLWSQIQAIKGITLDQEAKTISNELINCLTLLFRATAEVYKERVAKSGDSEKSKCVILFDEVQDLIKDNRLAAVGGIAVFSHLATLLVSNCIDIPTVNAAVAGSSSQIRAAFNKTVANNFRWYLFELSDPTRETIVDELRRLGYDDIVIDKIIDVCGTRLRLLEKLLIQQCDPKTIEIILNRHLDIAESSIKMLLNETTDDIPKLLDSLRAPTNTKIPLTSVSEKTQANVQFSNVFYADIAGKLRYQNRAIEKVWTEVLSKK